MEVKEATGRLGVLIPGLGAVATTLIAGVEAIKKGIAQPIGSITQMGNIHLNRRSGRTERSEGSERDLAGGKVEVPGRQKKLKNRLDATKIAVTDECPTCPHGTFRCCATSCCKIVFLAFATVGRHYHAGP